MEIKEEYMDLLSVDDNEYYLVQCISADFATVTGIILPSDKKYNYYDLRSKLKETFGDNLVKNYPKLNCILCDNRVFNLIVKKNNRQNQTYESVEDSLIEMKKLLLKCPLIKTNKIAISNQGLDTLDWEKIKLLIEKVFQDTNAEFLICEYKK